MALCHDVRDERGYWERNQPDVTVCRHCGCFLTKRVEVVSDVG